MTLVAVSKTVDRPAIEDAYTLGLRHFGENRVQRASSIFTEDVPGDIVLHLIGQLQTNKVRLASSLFGVIESVDREGLVAALEKEGARGDTTIPILLQVNVARESQKTGCDPDEVVKLGRLIAGSKHLELRGLMTIAPLVNDAEAVRPVFRQLRILRDDLQRNVADLELPVLSMGMTNDFQVAVEEGASHVRVGRALFGP